MKTHLLLAITSLVITSCKKEGAVYDTGQSLSDTDSVSKAHFIPEEHPDYIFTTTELSKDSIKDTLKSR